MELNILIWPDSVICTTAKKCFRTLCDLNDRAKKSDVTIEFTGDKITVANFWRARTHKIAKNIIGDPEKLCALIGDRIEKASK